MNHFIDIIKNSAINIITLFFVAFFSLYIKKINRKKIFKDIIFSIFLGFAYFIIITTGIVFYEGAIFDVRVVLAIISAFYFDFVPALVGAILGSVYRVSLGGSGAYGGVVSIMIPFFISSICRYKLKKTDLNNPLHVFLVGLFSVIGHFLVTFPVRGIEMITINYLVIYFIFIPIITVLVNNSFLIILKYQNLEDEIIKKDLVHKASIDSINALEIFAIDKDYNYLFKNGMHVSSMLKFYGSKVNDNYLDAVDDLMKNRIKTNIDKAFLGNSILDVIEIEVNKGKFIEERYTPIFVEDKIIGVTIISQDVTVRIKKEKELNFLSYHDILTGLKNRTYYQSVLDKINLGNDIYTVIYVDINGLKKVNDTYGHISGDELILSVSRELDIAFRDELLVARIGGDEFVVIIEGKDLEKVKNKITSINKNLSKIRINTIMPSISHGCSVKEETDNIETTIKIAEEIMYVNKVNNNKERNIIITDTLNTILHQYNVETNEHSIRVSDLAVKIGRYMKLSEKQINDLEVISSFHDIGKIIIPYNILTKKGKLTKEDWEIIKLHPEIGAKVVSSIPEYRHLKEDILHHHERYDGKGYPEGLKGEEIPVLSRIIAVCDAFDAMTHERPYKKTFTKEEAISEMKRESGKQFDPKIIEILLNVIN